MDLKDLFEDRRVFFEIKTRTLYINTGRDDIEIVRKFLEEKKGKVIELKKYKELK